MVALSGYPSLLYIREFKLTYLEFLCGKVAAINSTSFPGDLHEISVPFLPICTLYLVLRGVFFVVVCFFPKNMKVTLK